MSSSHLHVRVHEPSRSSANKEQIFSAPGQESLDFGADSAIPGSFDDSGMIRGVLIQSIKKCGKSRAVIAEEMSYMLARTITEKMLNAFTAESRDDRRWPGEFDRAFCKATGDNTLLSCRAVRAGLFVIDEDERLLLELGRQHFIRTQAEEQIASLQQKIRRVA